MGFHRYRALGNSLILIDWQEKSPIEIKELLQKTSWKKTVINLCKQEKTDGILIVINRNNTPECLMFNNDGTQGEKCLNGIRCIAYYLYSECNYPAIFSIFMHKNYIDCQIMDDQIEIKVPAIKYLNQVTTNKLKIIGHQTDAGNPHFVVLQKTDLEWLEKNGDKIAADLIFPQQTNVEFTWKVEPHHFMVLIYERGTGITLSCGSGAAAVLKTLHQLDQIKPDKWITIQMPGGKLQTKIDSTGVITQCAFLTQIEISC